MRAREWERVVQALEHLGCYVVRETDDHVTVARPVTHLQTIRKAPVPIEAQQHLIAIFGISEAEWEAALRAIRR